MTIDFTVPGEPQGKGRPKFARRGNFVSTYTPEKTASYENRVILAYSQQCKNFKFGDKSQLAMTIKAFFQPPKSVSTKKLDLMIDKIIRPTKKPDADNIAKIIADALNGIAYRDDSQIVSLKIEKYFDTYPRTEIAIEEINNADNDVFKKVKKKTEYI